MIRWALIKELESRAKKSVELSVDELGSMMKTVRETLASVGEESVQTGQPIKFYTHMTKVMQGGNSNSKAEVSDDEGQVEL
jgi:hypothetical protein